MNIAHFICGIFLFNARFMRNSDALALKVAAALVYIVACRTPVLRVPPPRLTVRRLSILEAVDAARMWKRVGFEEKSVPDWERFISDAKNRVDRSDVGGVGEEGMSGEARWLRVEDMGMSR